MAVLYIHKMMEWVEEFKFPNNESVETRLMSTKSYIWRAVRWSTLLVIQPQKDSVGLFWGFPYDKRLRSDWLCSIKFQYSIVDENGRSIMEGKTMVYTFQDLSQTDDARIDAGCFNCFDFTELKAKVSSFPLVRFKITIADTQTDAREKKFHNELARMFMDKTNSDVIIKVSAGFSFPAHKFILCARSEVFKVMFRSGMYESVSGEVLISDVDSDTMKEFLRYMYTGECVDAVLNEMSSNLLALAHRYQTQDLVNLCVAHMTRTLNNDCVINYLQLAIKYDLPLLNTACLKYIRQHKREIFQDISVARTLDDSMLQTILMMD